MVDQERMKEYIGMGMSIEDSLKLCQQEDAEAQKLAAKQAKIDAQATATNQKEGAGADTDKDDAPEGFVKKEDVEKIVAETLANQAKEAALKDATKNEGDTPKERTVETIMEEAVNRMRTGKN